MPYLLTDRKIINKCCVKKCKNGVLYIYAFWLVFLHKYSFLGKMMRRCECMWQKCVAVAEGGECS